MHFHQWSKWEDVKVGDASPRCPMPSLVIIVRQVITQQRRCSICNMVKTRHS